MLAGAFLAGLLGSVHCVAMCGPFAASCTRARGGLVAWHLGRVATYGALGAVAGGAGQILPGPAWFPSVLATLVLLWFVAGLAGLVPEPSLVPAVVGRAAAKVAGRPALHLQLAFGVANGLLPCGLVYAALSISVASAHPLDGALTMLAFGSGTVPALSVAAVGLRRWLLRDRKSRRLVAALVLATGLLALWGRLGKNDVQSHRHPEPVQPVR